MSGILTNLGKQLRSARKQRGLNQTELAKRVGRSFTRVSELERELAGARWGRDRLTLFADICDALDLVPVLVPRARLGDVEAVLEPGQPVGGRGPVTTPFDDLFVDLGNDDEE
jgi:transcriptional regulator with XRE-family HTH domain